LRSSRLSDYLDVLDSIEGWFYREDILLFEKINELQELNHVNGDLLEIGAYHGKSAILLGYFQQQGEQLVVCDLFEIPGQTLENRAENEFWYSKLTRNVFETNYLRFHRQLPVMLTCPSTKLLKVGRRSKTFRFIHIDGSHLYPIVRQDIQTAKTLLKDRGIVAFDDYRSIHTPGVAAAVWEEVTSGDLVPFCLTPQKMYATWDTNNLHLLNKLSVWANKQGEFAIDIDEVSGRKLLRIRVKP
jgi:Methyltransferase domain